MIQLLEGRYLTDGWHEAPRTYGIVEPASGDALGVAADADGDVARAAIDVAWSAFERWRAVSPFDRSATLRRWHGLIVENKDELAETMTREMGKPIAEARGEALYAAGFVEWYAEEAKRAYGEWVPTHVAHKRIVAMRQPVGPAFAVTPWNFPAAMITRKAGPALAAGCTMIVKPAEQTPFTALRLAELWLEAGGPEGTLQVLPTSDPVPVTEVMMADPRIRKVTFTGSTEVGRILYRQSAQTIKKLSLELGGHAPYLVFDDADLDAAVREVLACKFRNAGQTCVCTNRIYVQDTVHDAFVAAFADAVNGLKMGDPLVAGTDVGPLVDAQGMAKVEAHVADAVAKGATVVTGGARRDGLFFEPTLLTGVEPGMKLLEEETFGPVAPVLRFTTEAEAIERANATPFGLASYVYTRDLARAIRVAEALEYGIVGVNDGVPSVPYAPFGGVKQSGIGREGGPWGLEEYLETKFVSLGIG
ncbi:MAG: NAD-dependent succinate-semialdehyde dehydrogenase [Trueperaceae bacterium]